MATKSAYHFLTLTLLLLLSAAPALSSPRLEPELAAGCWKEIYQIPNCVFKIIKGFIGGGSINDVGVPCCKAFLSLTGDCQVEIFQNSTIMPLIENFCTAIVSSADSPPLPPAAPAPQGDLGWMGGAPPPAWAHGAADVASSGDVERTTSSFPWPTVRLV